MAEERESDMAYLEGEVKAFLGTGTEFQGTLTFEGTIRIDGKVSGEVLSEDTLIIGEDAEVEAEINVGTFISRGTVRGNVRASERIELLESSVLKGNIGTPKLKISEGAVFHGSCEMPQAADKVTPITPSITATEPGVEGSEEGGEAESSL